MLAGRILAVSPDHAFAGQLAGALQSPGVTVDVHRTLDTLDSGDLQALLCVLHVDGPLAHAASAVVPRLAGDCRVIVILPRADLAATVAMLQLSDRIAGVMTAEGFDVGRLRTLATKALTSDVFGLDKVMAPGSVIHAQRVGEHHEKAQCVALVSAHAAQLGVPRRHHESIEQCVDEMLMNALYDAPVDAQGNPLFSEITTRSRISLRTEQTVTVEFALDGTRFGVSVRDVFGSLPRQTVLKTLDKCLHGAQPIERKASGAGVGLYLMASSASSVSFNVVPGVATEVICTFTLESPKLVLDQLSLFWEPSDVSGRLGAPAAQVPAAAEIRPAESPSPRAHRRAHRRRMIAIMVLGAVALGLAGVAIWQRTLGDTPSQPGSAARPERPATMVELDSLPTGATVEIDGKAVGSTPLALTTLAPGSQVSIVFKRAGYHDATVLVSAPALGGQLRLVQPLEASDDVVRVHIVSTPPGARVLHDGQAATGADRTYTPADVYVEANKVQRFTLTMPGHAPLALEPFTPARGAGVIEKTATLQPE